MNNDGNSIVVVEGAGHVWFSLRARERRLVSATRAVVCVVRLRALIVLKRPRQAPSMERHRAFEGHNTQDPTTASEAPARRCSRSREVPGG